MKNSVRIVLFALSLGLICSLILAGATAFTAPYRKANEKAEEVRNFLAALEAPVDTDDADGLLRAFEEYVKVRQLGDLVLYEYYPKGSSVAVAVAVPFSGMGLWGPVLGVLALEPDLETIRGIRFYQQEETPGLGGEIGAEWFQAQFAQKSLVSAAGEPGFRISKPGSTPDRNSVDGISGATMTSNRVEVMLDAVAKQLFKERKNNVQ